MLFRSASPEPTRDRPRIRPVFLPFQGCPGRCLYCSQALQTGTPPEPLELVYSRLKTSFQQAASARVPPFEVAFYGGTFTRIPWPWPRRFISLAQQFRTHGLITRIRCSTRPDELETGLLTELKSRGLDLVELGVQSFSDRALHLSRRGYTGAQAETGCERVLETGLELGVQLLPGLPGHDLSAWLEDIRRTAGIRPAQVRIYPCQVLRGTPLERLWARGAYRPWSLPETLQALQRGVFRLYRAGIPVTRIGLPPEPGFLDNRLAGPWHPALGSIIKSRILLARLQLQAIRLGPGPKRLICPQQAQGQIFGHRGDSIERLKSIGIQPGDILFTKQEDFRLQRRAPP